MRTIQVISHTHWDREWYLTFQQFRLKLVHLIDGLLDLLDEDPNFKYFMLDGQTIVLDDYLAMRPEKETILRQHIRKGCIIIGPWHILPDMFLVGPEAHIRNLLQGDQTARKFGPKMMVGYIPDPFGHPGQVPQILQGFGIKTACLWRGLDQEPAEFWWQSPDGSRVFMAYLRDSYSNGASLPTANPPAFAEAISAQADSLAAHSATSDYLIMLGTDHMEPPPGTSAAIAYADKNLANTRVIHSTLPKFIDAIQTTIAKQQIALPMVTGELRQCQRMHLLPSVLSTRMWIKQRNHASENLLLKWVEPFSTFAALSNTNQNASSRLLHPAPIVRNTWRLLMENHPHDSICGCSIDQVHDEMKVRFDQVDQIGEELTRQSLESLAKYIATERKFQTGNQPPASASDLSSIVVFNPTAAPRTESVYTALELPADVNDFDVVDANGNSLPLQAHGKGSHETINMLLDAKGFEAALGSISDGRAAGMTVQAIKAHRDGSEVFIEAVTADGGEPNLAAWNAGRKQLGEFLADPEIRVYHVHARSVAATQIALTAQNVPGNGFQTLWVRPRTAESKAPMRISPLVKILLPLARLSVIQKLATRKKYARPPYVIENDFFIVQVLKDASLTILDKRTQITYSGLNHFQDSGDCGDEYNFAPPALDRIVTPRLKHVSLSPGPVQQSLELDLALTIPALLSPDRASRSQEQAKIPITTTITLSGGVPRVDIHTTVNNTARDHRLRVHFPAPFATESGHQDGHFEVVERRIGLPASDESWVEQPRPEVPQRAFTDISDGKSGLMVANRGLPEVEVLKNSEGYAEIALTLLRCVGWLSRDDFTTRKGHAGPFMETPGAQMPGTWSFDYSIIPHTGDWQDAFLQAYAFETPMRVVNTDLHEGIFPTSLSFMESSPATFVISAIKPSQAEHGWLVRGYNLTSNEITVTLKPWRKFRRVELVNLAEEKRAVIKSDRDGRVILKAGGHAILSVLFGD